MKHYELVTTKDNCFALLYKYFGYHPLEPNPRIKGMEELLEKLHKNLGYIITASQNIEIYYHFLALWTGMLSCPDPKEQKRTLENIAIMVEICQLVLEKNNEKPT